MREDVRIGNGLWAGLLLGILIFTTLLGWYCSLAPYPKPADAPEEEFSAVRAHEHVRVMAKESHVAGSPANEEVCRYIREQLEQLGLEVEWINEFKAGRGNITREQAVLGRIRGTDSTGAFAVDAHFDSVPYGPGAADDISGCAAMLEAARAIKAGPPLKNDVIFIFADQEERGANGAQAFTRHPWYADVQVILGLDVRGVSGPAMMFETAPENGWVIRQMAQSQAKPRATSIMYEFYKRMPFGSDFNKYRNDKAGLNVAYIDGFDYYHTKNDTPEKASLASLQHHGAYTLGLARQFGDVALTATRAPDAAYFNLIGSYMAVYPLSWTWPLTILALIFLGCVLVFGFASKQLSATGVLGGFGLLFATVLIAALLTFPLTYMVFQRFREHALYNDALYSFSFLSMGIGIFLAGATLLRTRLRPQNVLAASLIFLAVALLLLQVTMPGGSYFALWPLLFSTIALLLFCWKPEKAAKPGLTFIGATCCTMPVFCIWPPTLVMFSYCLTLLVSPFLIALVIPMLGLAMPQLYLLSQRISYRIAASLLILGFLVLGAAFFNNGPSPDKPWQNCLMYTANRDSGEAWWVSNDKKLDEYTALFFEEGAPRQKVDEFFPGHEGRYRKAPAPLPPFSDEAALELLEDKMVEGRRQMRFRLQSPANAYHCSLKLLDGARIFKAQAFGEKVPMGDQGNTIDFRMMPIEGGELFLEVSADKAIRFRFFEHGFGLPAFEKHPERPAHLMCEPNRLFDKVLGIDRPVGSEETHTVATYAFGTAQEENAVSSQGLSKDWMN